MKFITVLGAVALLICSGCATVTRGTTDTLVVISQPSGAKVQLSNGMSCASTPCTFKLPRRSKLTVTISKENCKTVRASVSHKTANSGAAGVAGNVLIGGVVGIGVDAATGASQDLTPNPLKVQLQCRGA